MIEVTKLPAARWQESRDLRLEALQTDPLAFGSSYEEEKDFTREKWQERMQNTLYALSGNTLVGMIVYIKNTMIKTKHNANIFGVYVKQEFRRQGIGKKLMKTALHLIGEDTGVIKVSLAVNPVQKVAVRLYEKIGFKTMGILKKELMVNDRFYDELVMEMFL